MSEQNGKQNGKARQDDRVRVALVGVGNCANSLLQGVEYYKDSPDDQFVPGLMHVNSAGTTSATSSSPLRSTSRRTRSARTCRRRSGRIRTTRSNLPRMQQTAIEVSRGMILTMFLIVALDRRPTLLAVGVGIGLAVSFHLIFVVALDVSLPKAFWGF